jgi:hypothetical protein
MRFLCGPSHLISYSSPESVLVQKQSWAESLQGKCAPLLEHSRHFTGMVAKALAGADAMLLPQPCARPRWGLDSFSLLARQETLGPLLVAVKRLNDVWVLWKLKCGAVMKQPGGEGQLRGQSADWGLGGEAGTRWLRALWRRNSCPLAESSVVPKVNVKIVLTIAVFKYFICLFC